MSFKLEDLPYQRQAISSVVRLFDGQQRNYFDLQLQGDCYPNRLDLSRQEILANTEKIAAENGISRGEATLCIDPDYCVEMETGTGKTLVYLRTIYELCREYGFTKFIILVPSVPIREGVLDTIESFRAQLERLYNIPLHAFEYDSKKLTKVKRFIEGTDLQVMVMTTHSFSADDNIINRPDRDDSPDGMSYWEALGKVRPIVIMDEPQEGMDTENLRPRLNALDSVARIRYSATHKTVRNLLYRLSPIDAYNQRLVKKIEVLSIAEINDEATLKLELVEIQTGSGAPKAKLKAWRQMATGFKYAETKWLKDGDSLEDATNNISYRDFKISHIRAKGLRGGDAMVKFHNGVELTPRAATGDINGIFRQQLYWLCYRHFEKVEKLKPLGIKPLSLIFIDRVANYMEPDGKIKVLFLEEFPRAYQDFYKTDAPAGFAHEVQAYYFAKTSSGEFTDNENSMAKQREIYDEILRDKEKLLAFDNPRQFIFSHSALGVGWDNPNVFNIATLNETYSDIKKRQEIGRGLRICRNQAGQRIYDDETTPEGQEVNLLTVIPNESYHTFVTQYQSELRSHVPLRHSPKGKPPSKKKVTLNRARLEGDSFKKFWQRLSQRTDYSVHFDEDTLIRDCIAKINQITLEHYEAAIEINRIDALSASAEARATFGGEEKVRLAADFTAMDLIEELSELPFEQALPQTLTILSGKEGRERKLYKLSRDQHKQFIRNKYTWHSEGPKEKLEILWKRHQGVLMGLHPETSGYFTAPDQGFEWIENLPEFPDWLLNAIVQKNVKQGVPAKETTRIIGPSFAINAEISLERDMQLALEAMWGMPPEATDDYDIWITVGQSLHSLDESLLDHWDEWSRQSDKHHPGGRNDRAKPGYSPR
jgi:type III restriction enzyme